ncbi:LysR family transcriptional regulator [Amycolatopsis rhizosphaerae]|uniref:LysR family transcriptional regulator n=1 Tax=Amycolatopsis rhizosphaerae TaxID=2053003 RepID=A0A558DCW7_9PSEU|nr:LysR family transcriptional regulator [Amycolatopsis rhizosphaerae]TVT58879.1 LysR family transcriptional regulator [Amycolatopsis rhizosphaerae]
MTAPQQDINVRRLRYFLAVAEHRHFGRAAESLWLSPTALSEQIRKLETELGVRLFDRNPRGAQLTEAGVQVAAEAREVLEAVARLGAVTARHRRRGQDVLRLGFVTMAAGELTSRILARFEREHPGRAVELVHLDYGRQAQAVATREVDAGIVRGPLRDSRLRTVLLATEPRLVMLSHRHPLAGRSEVRRADLAGELRVDTEGVPEYWRRWWSLDPGPDGTPPPYGPIVHTFEEQVEIAALGIAISIVPAAAARFYHRADVAFVPIVDAEPAEVLLCTHLEEDSPLVGALLAAAAPETVSGEAEPR